MRADDETRAILGIEVLNTGVDTRVRYRRRRPPILVGGHRCYFEIGGGGDDGATLEVEKWVGH